MVDTKNTDIVKKYFDLVQEEIKRLISEDKEIKPDQIELFNDEIFNQDEDIKTNIRTYIDSASTNNLDIKKVAKTLYDKFKLQVKNNIFNQKDVANVPNRLIGEKINKNMKTMNFDDFNNLNELNMNNPLKKDIPPIKIGNSIKKDFPPIKIGETKYPLDIVQDAFYAGQQSILNMPSIIEILNKYPNFVGHFSKDIPQFKDWWKNRK